MRVPAFIRVQMAIAWICFFGGMVACAVVWRLGMRDDRMVPCIEVQLAGIGLMFSVVLQWRDYRTGMGSAKSAQTSTEVARDSRAARESSEDAKIDVSRDSNGD